MTKQVIQLHTIEQWMQLDPSLKPLVLQNIKIKDRLHRYLLGKKKDVVLTEPKWVQCRRCQDDGQPGWVLLEPRYPGIHPSQMSQPCSLKIYNEMIGKEQRNKIEPRLQLIFDLGHAAHHMFQNYGRDGAWGPFYTPESQVSGEFQPLAKELMLEGSADAENILTIDDIPGCQYVFEVGIVHEYKTISSQGFKKLAGPKPEHKQQAMFYSAALNRPIIVYLYLNKDDSNLSDFPVAFDPSVWAVLEGKARQLKSAFDVRQPPAAEVGFNCKDCGFYDGCDAAKNSKPGGR